MVRAKEKIKKAAALSRQHGFQTRRVYDKSSPGKGVRFLVDGLWPRGVKKSALASAVWLREIAPSGALRKWFGHDPARWTEFQKRYRAELGKNSAACKLLLEAVKENDVALLFAAKDEKINNATVLKKFLEELS